ncbi:MAG: Na+/H+ antiporter subunit C [Opitutales bacterium]
METLLAVLIGVMTAAGVFCLLRRSIVKLAIGIILISQAANLTVFVSGGLTRGAPPLVASSQDTLAATAADPLPQALVLTAIVIGFGVVAFALVLIARAYQETGADDVNEFRKTEEDL